MRWGSLFFWNIRLQAKYGFYLLYTVLTVIYVFVLSVVPESWREKTAAVLIFSDPAAMGLFFMGAVVLLEKNQHTPCAFAVSPVCPAEYILAEVGALSVVSSGAAAVIALAAGVSRLPVVLIGTVLSGTAFTLLGIIVATKINSLNQFILWTVPVETVCFVPAILHLFKISPAWMRCYPANVCMDMVSGHVPSMGGFFTLTASIAALFVLAGCSVLKMWRSTGGGKVWK